MGNCITVLFKPHEGTDLFETWDRIKMDLWDTGCENLTRTGPG